MDAECAICLESLNDDEPVLSLNCAHTFHFECVRSLKNRKCPICRLAFPRKLLDVSRVKVTTKQKKKKLTKKTVRRNVAVESGNAIDEEEEQDEDESESSSSSSRAVSHRRRRRGSAATQHHRSSSSHHQHSRSHHIHSPPLILCVNENDLGEEDDEIPPCSFSFPCVCTMTCIILLLLCFLAIFPPGLVVAGYMIYVLINKPVRRARFIAYEDGRPPVLEVTRLFIGGVRKNPHTCEFFRQFDSKQVIDLREWLQKRRQMSVRTEMMLRPNVKKNSYWTRLGTKYESFMIFYERNEGACCPSSSIRMDLSVEFNEEHVNQIYKQTKERVKEWWEYYVLRDPMA